MDNKTKIQELFRKYTDECRFVRALRPETIRSYGEVFKTLLLIVPEVDSVDTLTEEAIRSFFKRLETRERFVGKTKIKTGIKISTIRTYGNKLRTFCDWLVDNKYLKTNPLDNMKLPNPVYEDHRALSREEVQKIITAVNTHSINSLMMRRDLAMVCLLLFCGLRRNELLFLQVRDIDFGKGLLTVRAEISKSKITRMLPIHKTLRLHLEDYIKERKAAGRKTEYLLVANTGDTRFTSHGLKHWVKRMEIASGVKFHIHRFRHTFATNLANNDVGAVKIQRLMGHASLNMTAVYLRSMKAEDLSDDIDKMSIEGLV